MTNRIPKLTKRTVEALKADGADTVYWDGELTGFGVRVRKSGRKNYVLQTRVRGKLRWFTIGQHGRITAVEARVAALEIVAQAKKGIDPRDANARRKAEPVMVELGRRFLEEYLPAHCKPSTQAGYRRSVTLFIDPALGEMRISEVERKDIAKLHHDMRDNRSNRTNELYRYEASRYLGDWLPRPLDAIGRADVEARFNGITANHGWSADEIDLEVLKAFAVTTDRERQMAVWEQVAGQGYRPSAWQVKRLLTEERVPGGTAIARFIGIEAYEAAGGPVMRDLFARDDESGVWFEDPVLLAKLATEKLRTAAAELATRWKWAIAMVEVSWDDTARYGRIEPEPGTPTDEEQTGIAKLEARQAELAELDDEQWTEELVAEAEAIETRLDEIEGAIEARSVWRREDFAIAGCIVTVGHDGTGRGARAPQAGKA